MSSPGRARFAFAVAACGPLLSGCLLLTEPTGYRLEISGLDAPDALSAGAPLEVTVAYVFGSCDELMTVRGERSGKVLTLEARGRRREPCRNSGDMQYFSDTVVTFTSLPPGSLTVRGLQHESWRSVELTVEIAPK
jgi:hypothetical protein